MIPPVPRAAADASTVADFVPELILELEAATRVLLVPKTAAGALPSPEKVTPAAPIFMVSTKVPPVSEATKRVVMPWRPA